VKRFKSHVLAAMLFCVAIGWAQASREKRGPFFGTWKLNLAKSKFNLGVPYKSSIAKMEPWEDGMEITVDTIPVQGQPTHTHWTGRLDGKDYAATGNPNLDSWAYTMVDDHTHAMVQKKNGKVMFTQKSVVSQDGNTRTNFTAGKNIQGQAVENVLIWDRQ
jgi:hypothetical protein